MNKVYALNAKTLAASTPLVKEVTNSKSVAVSTVICLVALAAIFFVNTIEDKSSSLYFAGITLVIITLIYGFYRLINKRSHLIYLPTKCETVSGSFYFDRSQLDKLKAALSDNPQSDLKEFNFLASGNSRLDYIVSRDNQFVAIQLYEFIPYNFEIASDIIIYNDEKARNLSKLMMDIQHKF